MLWHKIKLHFHDKQHQSSAEGLKETKCQRGEGQRTKEDNESVIEGTGSWL